MSIISFLLMDTVITLIVYRNETNISKCPNSQPPIKR